MLSTKQNPVRLYIQTSCPFAGGSLVPPQKVVSLKKGRGKERKRGEKKTDHTALRKKKGKEREEK